MKAGDRFRFIHWFALRDLLDPLAWRATRANGGSMIFVTAVTLAAVGLALGTSEIKRSSLAEDPLTLCLAVGNPNQAQITPPLVEKLGKALRDDPSGSGLLGFYPYHVCRFGWRVPGSNSRSYWIPATGRTILPTDPLPGSRKPICGKHFDDPVRKKEVVVTESLLEKLDVPKCPAPSSLVVDLASGPEEIAVVGVIKDLPNGHQFLFTEAYLEEIRANESIRYREVRTGPVPENLTSPGEMPADLQAKVFEQLENYGVKPEEVAVEPASKTRKRAWVLRSDNPDPPRRRDWVTLLETIRDVSGVVEPGFADSGQLTFREAVVRPDPGQKNFEMAGVYVKQIDFLPKAAALISGPEFGLPVLSDVIPQLEGFDRASGKALLTCMIGAVVLLVSSCGNLRVIQELRSELKIGEIGMLKAMGMGDGLLRDIYLYEAVLVWAGGTAIGLVLGYLLGALMSWAFIASKPSEILVGFSCPWYVWLLPLVTGPTFLASALLGIRRARRAAPIQTLRTS